MSKLLSTQIAERHAARFGGRVGMQNSPATRVTVGLDAQGYAHGVRCQHDHAGNRRLSAPSAGYCQCSGCGQNVSEIDVAAAQGGAR